MATFSDIPDVVIDHVRKVFAAANDRSSRALSDHPNMYEETLDHVLVMELSAQPSAYFAEEQISVVVESHWLGSRRMFGRWEIADIAIFVVLRQAGVLQGRKVALLQTKRLYANESVGGELEDEDFRIGIARIADRTDPLVSGQRRFTFDENSKYRALSASDEQTKRIDAYAEERGIPVYYGFHNPTDLPQHTVYPSPNGVSQTDGNRVGLRVMPASDVHERLKQLEAGQSPSVADLTLDAPVDEADETSTTGWRFERFVADEVLRCRQGALFEDTSDPNLRALFFGRTGPITAAISVTVDLASRPD